jgi:hypothetical protein
MSECEAGCGSETKEGRRTCGSVLCAMKIAMGFVTDETGAHVAYDAAKPADSEEGGERYDDEAEALIAKLDARAMFLLVLDGDRGSDFSIRLRAATPQLELWTRRLLNQVRRVAARCERALDAQYDVPDACDDGELVPQAERAPEASS